jgi:hypothetical protein
MLLQSLLYDSYNPANHWHLGHLPSYFTELKDIAFRFGEVLRDAVRVQYAWDHSVCYVRLVCQRVLQSLKSTRQSSFYGKLELFVVFQLHLFYISLYIIMSAISAGNVSSCCSLICAQNLISYQTSKSKRTCAVFFAYGSRLENTLPCWGRCLWSFWLCWVYIIRLIQVRYTSDLSQRWYPTYILSKGDSYVYT